MVKHEMKSVDIIRLNSVQKPWGSADYLNFFILEGNQEYRKLDDFIKKHGIGLRVAMNIMLGETRSSRDDFKDGKFTFSEQEWGEELDTCWETIGVVKKLNGYNIFLNSTRFWRALLKLVRHPDFVKEKWMHNLTRMVGDILPKRTGQDYVKMLQRIYNWKNSTKIELDEVDECNT